MWSMGTRVRSRNGVETNEMCFNSEFIVNLQ